MTLERLEDAWHFKDFPGDNRDALDCHEEGWATDNIVDDRTKVMVEEINNPSTLNLKTEPVEDLTDKELSSVEAGSSKVKEEHTDTGTFSKTT